MKEAPSCRNSADIRTPRASRHPAISAARRLLIAATLGAAAALAAACGGSDDDAVADQAAAMEPAEFLRLLDERVRLVRLEGY